MSLLTLTDVEMSYGLIKVLHGITAEIHEGEVFAIIGPNGAGKTTLFKAMTGEAFASAGKITFDGQDVTRLPPHLRTRLGIGRTFQVARVFLPLSALQNVVIAIEARLRAKGQKPASWWHMRPAVAVETAAMELLAGVSLAQKAMMRADALSHGDRKRLELAMTLAGEPRVLMMDEPTAGMSAADREQVIALLRDIRERRTASGAPPMTIVMTEHDMAVIFGLASRIFVMNQGRRVALGSVDEVRSDPMVQQVYLGSEDQSAEAVQ